MEDQRLEHEHKTQQAQVERLRELDKTSSVAQQKQHDCNLDGHLKNLARAAGLDPKSFVSNRDLLIHLLGSGTPVETLMSQFENILGHNFTGVRRELERKGKGNMFTMAVINGLESMNTSSAELFAQELGYATPNLKDLDMLSSHHRGFKA